MPGQIADTSQQTGSLSSVPVEVNTGTTPTDPGKEIVRLSSPMLQLIVMIVAPGAFPQQTAAAAPASVATPVLLIPALVETAPPDTQWPWLSQPSDTPALVRACAEGIAALINSATAPRR